MQTSNSTGITGVRRVTNPQAGFLGHSRSESGVARECQQRHNAPTTWPRRDVVERQQPAALELDSSDGGLEIAIEDTRTRKIEDNLGWASAPCDAGGRKDRAGEP